MTEGVDWIDAHVEDVLKDEGNRPVPIQLSLDSAQRISDFFRKVEIMHRAADSVVSGYRYDEGIWAPLRLKLETALGAQQEEVVVLELNYREIEAIGAPLVGSWAILEDQEVLAIQQRLIQRSWENPFVSLFPDFLSLVKSFKENDGIDRHSYVEVLQGVVG